MRGMQEAKRASWGAAPGVGPVHVLQTQSWLLNVFGSVVHFLGDDHGGCLGIARAQVRGTCSADARRMDFRIAALGK